jgi:hypothetical protein
MYFKWYEPGPEIARRAGSRSDLAQHVSNARRAIRIRTARDRANAPKLCYRRARWLERVKGIEPSSKAWEAFVLPLNYTRVLDSNLT